MQSNTLGTFKSELEALNYIEKIQQIRKLGC